MQDIIETYNLTKYFTFSPLERLFKFRINTRHIVALENINIKVKEGTCFVLVGPNGAGKTTFIKILCGLILPTKGEIKIAGLDGVKQAQEIKRLIGLVTGEERSFYWRLTGWENLDFFARLSGNDIKRLRDEVEKLASFLNIEDELNKQFSKFSAGARQKLSIIRALLNNPKIIFMDEPTRSLDPETQVELRKFIKEKLVKEEKKTLFVATHNLYEAEELADELGIIVKAKIVVVGDINSLRNNTGKENASIIDIFKFYSLTGKRNEIWKKE